MYVLRARKSLGNKCFHGEKSSRRYMLSGREKFSAIYVLGARKVLRARKVLGDICSQGEKSSRAMYVLRARKVPRAGNSNCLLER